MGSQSRTGLYRQHTGGSVVKNLPANAGDTGSIPGSGRSRGEGNATHSSILVWEIPWTEEPDRATVHGILQARILEWGALPFSRGSS